ncbi:MAG: 4Fe-4S dicluster domain-containing protein [Spirochaetia bacterium]|jgi:formate dehydrogenase subunit beta|nr:4Fe-4S dicluster domain-containing protein [Spirochaetia bacterium]
MNIVLNTADGRTRALRNFLKNMLENKILYAVIAPVEINKKITGALVRSPELMDKADPLAPVMPVNMARIVSDITKSAPPSDGKKIGVLLRSCEARALIELVKLNQASLENIITIGIDCFGTYPIKIPETGAREACQMCEYPEAPNTDITIGLAGYENDSFIILQGNTADGDSLLESYGAGAAAAEQLKKREDAIESIRKERIAKRDDVFARYLGEITGLENLHNVFASCINCHNCRNACPVCYCRECLFDSPTFEWKADNYISLADKHGSIAVPRDRLLFHLTRLNHMAVSCVGCGACEEACPNGISVFSLFRLSGDRVQAAFNYIAGRSMDEPLPVTEFRENELESIGNQ